MNTRLQVEHPVTELVTGLDLVRLQLLVAQGLPLPPEVAAGTHHRPRRRGAALRRGPDPRLPAGHRHAARLRDPRGEGVRVDSGVESGSVVGMHYDAMLAKVVAHGATREEASARLAAALAGARLHGVRDQPRPAGAGAALGRLAVRRRRHLLPRAARPEGARARRSPTTRRCALHALAAALGAAADRRATATVLARAAVRLAQPAQRAADARRTPSASASCAVGYAHRRSGTVVEVDGARAGRRACCCRRPPTRSTSRSTAYGGRYALRTVGDHDLGRLRAGHDGAGRGRALPRARQRPGRGLARRADAGHGRAGRRRRGRRA